MISVYDFFLFPLFSFSVFCDFSDFPSSFLQRLDVSAVTHDHGGDITKSVRLGGLHSFLCICHELDLSVQKGVACPLFAKTFEQAAHINSILRNCRNLYRRLRSEQVNFVLIIVSPRSLRSYSFVDSRWSSGNMTVFQWLCHRCMWLPDGNPNLKRCGHSFKTWT